MNEQTKRLADALEARFSTIEDTIARNELSAMAVFTRMRMAVATVIQAYDAQPDEVAKDGWVSVEERLPEKTDWLLVFADGAMATRAWNADARRFEDWEGTQHAGLHMSDITHWRELPQPPEDAR